MHSIFRGNMEMWANKEKKQRYRAYYKNTQISFKETQSRGGRGNLEHSSPPKRIMMIMTGCHFFPFPNQSYKTYDPEVQDDSNIRETWTYYTICVY